MSASTTPHRLRDVLEPWCAAGVDGALRLQDAPGGAVYLVDGRIAYAECPVVSGADRLLTASGRLPAEAWRAASAAGRSRGRIGAELVAAGLLTWAELEMVALLALYDAAHVLFDAAIEVRFEPGARHALGTSCTVDLEAACREVDRRKRALADAWPDPTIDTAAVVPARRLPDQSVALTALQWEVVANADRRRSPIDLARLLGRDVFTVMLEVRHLARAGLVEPGRPAGSAAAESVATVRARAAAPVVATAAVVAIPLARPPADPPADVAGEPPGGSSGAGGGPGPAGAGGATGPTDSTSEGPAVAIGASLPRRRVPAENGAALAPVAPTCSEDLLLRLRAGLAALQ